MRILGLDYGESRIGAAISDESEMIARGLTTLVRKNRQRDLQAVAGIVETHRIGRIVVGYPLRLDGTEGVQCEKVRRFAGLLERTFPLPVVCWDETFSTSEAHEMMIQAKVNRRKRKGVVDRVAAAIILQDYLDAHRKEEDDTLLPDR